MKKQILLAAALCSVAFGTVNAQLQTGRSDAGIGCSDTKQENGNQLVEVTFNTNKGYSTDASNTNRITCNSIKGFCAAALTTEGLNSNLAEYIGKSASLPNHWVSGTNQTFKAKRYKDVATLVKSFSKEGDAACSVTHDYWKCANIIMDVPGTDAKEHAWAVWSGINKRRVMMIAFAGTDGLANLAKDIEFELMTLDAGTTGQASTYKMILDLEKNSVALGGINKAYSKTGDDVALLDSISSQNIDQVNAALGSKLLVVDNIYTTTTDGTLDRKTIKLAESVGLSINDIRGKKINIILYGTTSGTPVQPGLYEPTIGVKNIRAEYSSLEWVYPILPTGAVADTVKADVIKGEEAAITFRLADKGRYANLVIVGDGDNKMSSSFYFKEEGCVMSKNEATGEYDIPVTYTYKPTDIDAQTPMSMTVPGSVDGAPINDDMQVTIFAKLRKDGVYRLELNNGTRLLIDVLATAIDAPVNVTDEAVKAAKVRVQDNSIFVENATEDVLISNTAGQMVKTVSAEVAGRGIAMVNGIYLVKTGNIVEKVLVK